MRVRGLDIFELSPTEFLTQNEIDAAKTVRVTELNVQNQQKIEWPARLVERSTLKVSRRQNQRASERLRNKGGESG